MTARVDHYDIPFAISSLLLAISLFFVGSRSTHYPELPPNIWIDIIAWACPFFVIVILWSALRAAWAMPT
jgi:hypothetical protein